MIAKEGDSPLVFKRVICSHLQTCHGIIIIVVGVVFFAVTCQQKVNDLLAESALTVDEVTETAKIDNKQIKTLHAETHRHRVCCYIASLALNKKMINWLTIRKSLRCRKGKCCVVRLAKQNQLQKESEGGGDTKK